MPWLGLYSIAKRKMSNFVTKCFPAWRTPSAGSRATQTAGSGPWRPECQQWPRRPAASGGSPCDQLQERHLRMAGVVSIFIQRKTALSGDYLKKTY